MYSGVKSHLREKEAIRLSMATTNQPQTPQANFEIPVSYKPAPNNSEFTSAATMGQNSDESQLSPNGHHRGILDL